VDIAEPYALAYDLKEFAAPALEPVTLAELKGQARLESGETEHDVLLNRLIKAVRIAVEKQTNRSLIETTWDYFLEKFPASGAIRLPRSPLISVTSITYVATDGTETTLATAEYVANGNADPPEIFLAYNKSWPALRETGTANLPKPLRVRFKAGYGTDGSSVPANLKIPILMLAAHLFERREAFTSENLGEVQMAVQSFLSQEQVSHW